MRPVYNFSRYSDSGLEDKATQIHSLMSVLPLFPNPPIAYAAVLVLIQNYSNAIALALNHDKIRVSVKNEARAQVEEALKSLAIYIMSITDDKVEIESTGFDVTEEPSPIGIPQAPSAVSAESAGPRSVKVDWKRVHGANNYVVEMTTSDPQDPAAVWTVVGLPTKSKLTIENLQPLTYYWFRVKANGSAGLGQPSSPAVGLSI